MSEASSTAASSSTSTTTVNTATSAPQTAVSVMQSLMSTAVQQALPSLQASITSSLDARIQGAMRQQREQMQTWLQLQLSGPRTEQPANPQGQTYYTTNDTAISTDSVVSSMPMHMSFSGTAPVRLPGVPVSGCMPPASLISGVPIMSTAASSANSSSGSSQQALNLTAGAALSPHTPLATLLSQVESASSEPKKAVVIGTSYPPIPYKIAEAIWRDEYIDLAELLPARLGAPEPTLLELFSGNHNKRTRIKKNITTIEEWVLCFNAYIAVAAQKRAERVPDLLAYSSLIVKASRDYEETPWLSYDQHYRRYAAAKLPMQWGAIQPEIWTLHFGRARAKQHCSTCGEMGHAKCECAANDTPTQSSPKGASQQQMRPSKKWAWSETRTQPYSRVPPICKRWNRAPGGCRLPECSFRHVCLECHGNHRESDCQQAKRRPTKPPVGRGSTSQSGTQQ